MVTYGPLIKGLFSIWYYQKQLKLRVLNVNYLPVRILKILFKTTSFTTSKKNCYIIFSFPLKSEEKWKFVMEKRKYL